MFRANLVVCSDENDFNKANGHIEAFIKDDLGTISLVIDCQDSELKEEMYLALESYHPN